MKDAICWADTKQRKCEEISKTELMRFRLDVFHLPKIGCTLFFKFYSQKAYFKPRAIIRPNMATEPLLLKLYSWPHIQENKSKGC